MGKSRRQVLWPQIRTQRNHFNCFEKKQHILPFHFGCLWWWLVINSHIYVNKSQQTLSEWKWINLVEFSFGTNFISYASLSIVLCKFQTDYPVFLRKAICPIYLYFTFSEDYQELLIKYPKLLKTQNTSVVTNINALNVLAEWAKPEGEGK